MVASANRATRREIPGTKKGVLLFITLPTSQLVKVADLGAELVEKISLQDWNVT